VLVCSQTIACQLSNDLTISSLGMQSLLKGGSWDTIRQLGSVSVDVRDVAAAHILAAEIPSANVRSPEIARDFMFPLFFKSL
jgi:hypothetical protein